MCLHKQLRETKKEQGSSWAFFNCEPWDSSEGLRPEQRFAAADDILPIFCPCSLADAAIILHMCMPWSASRAGCSVS